MRIKLLIVLLLASLGQLAFGQSDMEGDYVRLVDPLDEPEFYCFDLAGWGDHLQLEDPLQTHTCKVNGRDDQMFALVSGKIQVTGTDRCLQAAGSSGNSLPGSALLVRSCSDNPLQQFRMEKNGQIRLGSSQYCVGAGDRSTPASGPSHLWRTMQLVDCATADKSLSSWQVGLN